MGRAGGAGGRVAIGSPPLGTATGTPVPLTPPETKALCLHATWSLAFYRPSMLGLYRVSPPVLGLFCSTCGGIWVREVNGEAS